MLSTGHLTITTTVPKFLLKPPNFLQTLYDIMRQSYGCCKHLFKTFLYGEEHKRTSYSIIALSIIHQ
jgi:hypothetical protein